MNDSENSIVNIYKRFFKKSFDIMGVDSVRQFWIPFAFNTLFVFCLSYLGYLNKYLVIISIMVCILFFVPTFTSAVRRLRHANRSPFLLLWLFVPIVGWMFLIVDLSRSNKDDKYVSKL